MIDKIYGSCLVKKRLKSSIQTSAAAESTSRFDCRRLLPSDNEWPIHLASGAPSFLDVIGDAAILSSPWTAIFCSSRCSGGAVLKSTKWVRNLSEDANLSIIAGFHSAMEKVFLEILLDGKCRICVCPARSLVRYRIPRALTPAIESGRLAIVSSLPPSVRSNSASSSYQRNQLVADLAQQIVVTHAAEGSRTEQFAISLLEKGRVVGCLDIECKRLIALGAKVIDNNVSVKRTSE